MEVHLVTWIFGQITVAAAIWGGIRSDVKNIHTQIEKLEKSQNETDHRIDRYMDKKSFLF